MQRNTLDLIWLAGIMEGEGCFTTSTYVSPTGKKHLYPRVTLCMTDEDVVRRAHGVAGLGMFYGPETPKSREGHKPTWTWKVQKKAEAIEVMGWLLPLMGARRQARIVEILELVA